MEESQLENLLTTILNSPATKSIVSDKDGSDIIKEIIVKVPKGNFYHNPLYITLITEKSYIFEDESLFQYNLDGRYWEDHIIPDILSKYFTPEEDRVVFVKIKTKENHIIFPESWGSESQYNNF